MPPATQIPTTWDELMALSDQIVADGDTPWCIGIESRAATGWPATDWTEDVMLRTTSLENYDKWVAGELPFASPEVKNAAETSGRALVQRRLRVRRTGCDRVDLLWRCSGRRCSRTRPSAGCTGRATSSPASSPKVPSLGVDYDFFYLPADRRCLRQAVPGGWRHLCRCSTTAHEVRALMEYFTTAAVGQRLAGQRWGDLAAQHDCNSGYVRR